MSGYCISDTYIILQSPEWAIHDNLKHFLNETDNTPDMICRVVFEHSTDMPKEKAVHIMKSPGVFVYYYNESYHFRNRNAGNVICDISIATNLTESTIYVYPEYCNPYDAEIAHSIRDGVLGALRVLLIMLLSAKSCHMIHSSTIISDGRGIMFAGESGSGKSTHTALWKKLYGAEILDGDITACRIEDGVPFAYGLPWCGTSGQFLNRKVPLQAIIFLQKSKENSIKKLEFGEAFQRLYARCFLIPLDSKIANQVIDAIQGIAACADCYVLNCRPDEDAVRTVWDYLMQKNGFSPEA